eukprot:353108-Chlamydomonas_euryale.AAC.10
MWCCCEVSISVFVSGCWGPAVDQGRPPAGPWFSPALAACAEVWRGGEGFRRPPHHGRVSTVLS